MTKTTEPMSFIEALTTPGQQILQQMMAAKPFQGPQRAAYPRETLDEKN